MRQEIDPKETSRAQAFALWMKSPMPMVTVVKKFDVTHLRRASKRRRLKFNMLLCWCIGRAASQMDEFYLLPIGDKLYKFDRLGINVIVENAAGGISSCDIPFSNNLEQFGRDYDLLTQQAARECHDITDAEAMVFGTSAVVATELDCIVNQYSGIFNNPFFAWGRYRRSWFRTKLRLSLQFHHAQLDGKQAALFLEKLQQAMNEM